MSSLIKNRFKIIITITISVFVLSVGFAVNMVFSAQSKYDNPLPKDQRYLTDEEVSKIANSQEYTIAKEKTEKRLNDAWNDIVNTFQINKSEYFVIEQKDLGSPDLLKKWLPNINWI